jgi:molecular chaperone DnaJ
LKERNPFHTLDIPEGSGLKEIRKAYRRLVLKYHPDRHPGDVEAPKRFLEVQRAYEALLKIDRQEESRKDAPHSEGFDRAYSDFYADPFLAFYMAANGHFGKGPKENDPNGGSR